MKGSAETLLTNRSIYPHIETAAVLSIGLILVIFSADAL